MSSLTESFVDGLEKGVLRYQRCEACDQAQSLARHACTRCGNEQLAWHDAGGSGTVLALSVVHRAPSDSFRALVPYTLVLVELMEGVRIMGHAAADVAIADKVRAGFFEFDGRRLIRFAKAAENDAGTPPPLPSPD